MTEKKRKSKRPKAMRVTTEASKAKLPTPRQKRKAKPRETWAEGYAKWEAKAGRIPRVRCPFCEKVVPAGPHDIHTCYDAKALREFPASPIAGQPIDGIGSQPAPEVRAIPCGEDHHALCMASCAERGGECPCRTPIPILYGDDILLPPDTSAYPWGLRFAWWLDGVPTRVRRWLAKRLTRLAEWVTP